MNIRASVAAAIASLLLGCFAAHAATFHAPWTAEGTVLRVHDGDTLVLRTSDRGELRVRFSGIDAPETGQRWWRSARRFVQEQTHGRTISVRCYKADEHGREVCDVLREGEDLGLRMVEEGHAWHFERFASEQPAEVRTAYREAQAMAREARRGLWRDDDPQPPWECRVSRRARQACR